MTKTMKNTVFSVIVLAAIAAVSVLLLSLANAFFPKYKPKLDLATAKLINTIVETGVDAGKAFEEGYFSMRDLDEVKLDEFNKGHAKDSANAVLALYDVNKGPQSGFVVAESQAQGYGGNPPIKLLTAFDTGGLISGVAVRAQSENPTGPNNLFLSEYFEKFREYVKGKSKLDKNGIMGATGATNVFSVGGVADAVNIAADFVALQSGAQPEQPGPEQVTDEAVLDKLIKSGISQSYTSYPVPTDFADSVYGIYKGDTGDILIAGRAETYGGTEMALIVTKEDGAVLKVTKLAVNETVQGAVDYGGANPESLKFYNSMTDEWLTERFAGKTLADLKDIDNSLSGTTGATLVYTSYGIKQCLIGAMEYYPRADVYINSFGEEN